jgi:hypothetical protein
MLSMIHRAKFQIRSLSSIAQDAYNCRVGLREMRPSAIGVGKSKTTHERVDLFKRRPKNNGNGSNPDSLGDVCFEGSERSFDYAHSDISPISVNSAWDIGEDAQVQQGSHGWLLKR